MPRRPDGVRSNQRGFTMSNVEKLHIVPRFSKLHIEEDIQREVYWCNMHADLASRPDRACFRNELVDEILSWQHNLSDRIRNEQSKGTHKLAHIVLASCHPTVFNLGGDLQLFCNAIRGRDRTTLLNYARQCVRGVHAFHNGLGVGAHSIALVEGDALGGGFEAALSCHTIVAEEGVGMGLPEVLFDLFPGMGAYSFLCKRIPAHRAESLMLEGNVYGSEELHKMGLVDVLVPKGEGRNAVDEIIRNNRRIPHARAAMHRVRAMAQPVTMEEMMAITEVWVDTALQLGEKSLRTMERLVRAQFKRDQPLDAAMA
jgi:DSF synthase